MTRAFEHVVTERLLLRALRETDLEVMYAIHADPETNRYHPGGLSPTPTLDAARARLDLWLGDWAGRGVGYWAVERREAPGVVIGFGGVRHRELEGQQVLNLAYRFTPSAWGAGYATELAREALSLAGTHIPDVPVVAIISVANAPSLRVAERLGMRFDRLIDYEGFPSRVYLSR
ncbi:GNAT family N-acetyltransferase [Pyxidicoccus fallax]|uniref:GNAT family N-acetyltransferase n=1 Tax=Pyxidicoccus fallax TaxID=394095 RepID=A0A848LC85_9BACT|nr:GNAT family N-acetyltransferase [Pyxidicoccus fallax]NMO16680.1 GNAT family N-acetyltransferase [Pyxidicoccus fallax]NPC79245.1 GNAT family N-acetyltransferase [Pyxidicoccus fallax]